MTREEAISLLSQVNHILVNSNSWLENTHEPLNIAFDMAIKALKQEPCEDAISRKAVLDTLDKMDSVLDEDRTVETYKELLIACYNDLPSVTPERPKGHWINIDKTHSKCDKCESVFEIVSANGESNYCPNCGAEME